METDAPVRAGPIVVEVQTAVVQTTAVADLQTPHSALAAAAAAAVHQTAMDAVAVTSAVAMVVVHATDRKQTPDFDSRSTHITSHHHRITSQYMTR